MNRLPVVATLIGLLISNTALFAQQDLQVAVEVRFITVSDSFFEKIGVDFDFGIAEPDVAPGSIEGAGSLVGDLTNSFSFDFGIAEPGSPADAGRSPFIPGSFFAPPAGLRTGILSGPQLQTVVRALEKKGGDSLVSTPRIVTNNGQSVRIDPPPPTPNVFLPPPDLRIIPTIGPDGAIDMNIGGDSFFNPFERTFDIFSGAAMGNMSQTETRTHTHQETITTEREESVQRIVGYEPYFNGLVWIDRPIYGRRRVVTQQEETVTRVETEEFMRGSFEDQATIFGMRYACFCGLYFGMGGLVQYMDGDLHGAWAGELQGIARYPVEFQNWAFAPYLVTGVGAFLSTDNYPTFSLGGGVEFRTGPNVGIFTEARQTWTDDSDMNFASVIGGIRIVTDGRGLRRARTTVLIKDGQTVVLGGLHKTTSRDRLPILGNLPGLGSLFRNRESTRGKDNLLIFLTPSIVRED